jgi:lipopolysaccharide biosynthesis glycosyltransferase
LEILTIYNYPPADYHLVLLRMWLHQVAINNDAGCKVIVLSEQQEPENIKEWHSEYLFTWQRLKSKRKQCYPIFKRMVLRFSSDIVSYRKTKTRLNVINHHNVRFKLYHLTKWPRPFIFLDVDAILFGPISKLVEASKDKPFIVVNHQDIPKHTEGKKPYLNGGVQIVSQPSFFTYEDFTKQTEGLICPGHEQALIYTHFRNIGYDYTHTIIDYKWNSCSGYNEVKKVEGKWVCISKGSNVLDSDLKSNTIPKGVNIMINHYWDEFKPWKIACPMYKEFIGEVEVVK